MELKNAISKILSFSDDCNKKISKDICDELHSIINPVEKVYIYYVDRLISYNSLLVWDESAYLLDRYIDVSLLSGLVGCRLMFFENGVLIFFRVKIGSITDYRFYDIVDLILRCDDAKFVCEVSSFGEIDLSNKETILDLIDIVRYCMFGKNSIEIIKVEE